ncbi:hypothetical protein [Serratia proteamaculans]|uniref:hypothetical protein n=1 Tax=Serratia proteamaculans TaxID=28151 RepID=UPI0021BD484A|nr:hypothetical protein [Serratia proteamaculans]
MDDFIIFTRTRWHARRALKRLLSALTREDYEAHPDKTQLGRIEKGFDWLGLWFAEKSIHISPRAKQNHRDRCARLYEQGSESIGPSGKNGGLTPSAPWVGWNNGDSPGAPPTPTQ